MSNALEAIDRLKEELDSVRPLLPDVLARVEQKLRIEANYNSNAIEGNSLTLGETRTLILHGLTARGKPMRDHLDIEGHDTAVKAVEDAIRNDHSLNEVFIRNLHRILLKEPYEADAVASDGGRAERTISIGEYKTVSNNVITSTGEIYHFTPPEQVKSAMSDLVDWYREKEREDEHPIIIAATFHYRFVRIHPFDDGNGRMARLLMNMILIRHGYTIAMIHQNSREEYLRELENVDRTEDLTQFIDYVANCCEYSLSLYLKAARGEPIESVEDIDREIALFRRSLSSASDETLLVGDYLDSILQPFYDHCQRRIGQFSDVFGRVQTLISVFTTAKDGQVVRLFEDSTVWPCPLNRPEPAIEARSITFISSIYLTNFQGRQDDHILIEVKNETDPRNCYWTFSIGAQSVNLKYSGKELEEIKKRFNEIIREMMVHLELRRT